MKLNCTPYYLLLLVLCYFLIVNLTQKILYQTPIIETQIEETPTLLTSLSFEETYTFEANLLGGPHKENNLIVYCISKTPVDDSILTV